MEIKMSVKGLKLMGEGLKGIEVEDLYYEGKAEPEVCKVFIDGLKSLLAVSTLNSSMN